MPPLHPMVVHFPIALFVVAVLFDFMTAYRISRVQSEGRHSIRAEIGPLNAATRILMTLGFIGSVVAVASGEWLKGERGEFLPHSLLSLHQSLAILFTVWYAVLLYIRLRSHWRPSKVYLGTLLVGLLILTSVGHTGGEMAWPAQSHAGLPQASPTSGTALSQTGDKPPAKNAISSTATMPVAANHSVSNPVLLKLGDKGSKVSQLQQQLSDLGYLNHTVSGFYGPATVDSVKSFQVANHLPQTGSLDEATENAILNALGQKKVASTSTTHTTTTVSKSASTAKTQATASTQIPTFNQAAYNTGYQMFVSSCASCHSLETATQYYGRLSSTQWTQIVNQMQSYAGGSIPDTKDIIYYLDHHH